MRNVYDNNGAIMPYAIDRSSAARSSADPTEQTVRRVGIFRAAGPLFSEPFVMAHARHFLRYQPRMLLRRRLGPLDLPHWALSDHDFLRVRDIAFAFGLHPRLTFGGLDDLSLIHAHFGPDGLWAMKLARSIGVPLIVTIHGMDGTISFDALASSRVWSFRQYAKKFARLVDGTQLFLCVSDFIRGQMISRGVPPEKLRTHYIGIDVDRFHPAATPVEVPYVLAIARLERIKGVDLALRAFHKGAEKWPHLEFWIIGDGSERAALESLSRELGIGHRVRFLGVVPNDAIIPVLQGARALLHCPRTGPDGWREGFGLVLTEAQACGVCVVGTRTGGTAEAVEHGASGFLCDEEDVGGLASAMELVFADPDRARAMGMCGRERVLRLFSVAKQACKLEGIYDDVRDQAISQQLSARQ